MLRRYHQRGELLHFLEEPLVEPTNNRVERALRLAVIARKVSQCSKNQAGAYAFSAFKSVIQTLVKRALGLWWKHYMPSSALRKPRWSLANSFKGAALITYFTTSQSWAVI